jgi:predicted nucleotide-binding protein (sugar kinase/HSP70/actin superfamily)
MSDGQEKLEVVCPCCQATLTIESKTGLVLHSREKKTAYSFEDALQQVKKRKDMADELFQKAFTEEKKRKDSLEEKFQQALERKDELDDPARPWDMD